MNIEHETTEFADFLHGVVVYMRKFLHAQTEIITIILNTSDTTDTAKYAITAMEQLDILGLGDLHTKKLGSIITYEFHKVASLVVKNSNYLHNSIRKLGLNVEKILQIYELGEFRRYPH